MADASLVAATPRALGAELAAQSSALAHYIELGLRGSQNTQRAYQSDLRSFETFCAGLGLCSLPAEAATVSRYIIHLADEPLRVRSKKPPRREPDEEVTPTATRRLSTIRRHLAAITKQHSLAGYASPVLSEGVALVLKGVTVAKGKKQRQAPAFTLDQLRGVLQSLDLTTPAGLRDRALLLLGFFGAFRRSELVDINIEHLEWRREALLVHMQRSKTNQHGLTEDKAFFFSADLLYCPLRAVEDWLAILERATGPLFVSLTRSTTAATARPSTKRLSAHRVNMLVQGYFGKEFSAHSLRCSFITIAVQNGEPTHTIKNQTKHKSNEMIDRYTRLNDVMVDNAGKRIRL